MTSITTNSYAFDKHSLFRLLVSYRYKKRWWISAIGLAGVLALLYFNLNKDLLTMVIAFSGVLVLGTAMTLFSIWRFVSAKSTAIYYRSRYHVMDTEKVSTFLEDGSTNSTMISSYYKAGQIGEYYLLYLSRGQYAAVPRSVFKTLEDQQWFETNIIGRIKKPGF